jgi:anthranilate phosphoribosyltransferase
VSSSDPALQMRSVLQRIATGPEYSKDVPRADARAAMRSILDGAVDPVQAGVFLIAMRMKRESDEENLGMLEAIRETTLAAVAPVDDVLDLADPYDGFIRSLPASPFLPALLAALGVPTVSHGVESMGPKHGITHRQVLRAAGLPVDLTPAEAARRIGEPAIGWAYVDQAAFNPRLYSLTRVRELIVKRPPITTLEVLAGPVRGRARTHLLTGYVHKAYPRVYALLARDAGYASALIVRGVEGGVLPSLCQTGRVFRYADGGEERQSEFQPAGLGIDHKVRAARIPGVSDEESEGEEAGAPLDRAAAAKAAAEAGLAALSGERGPTRDSLAYAAALCLWHLGREPSVESALARVNSALDAGSALTRLGKG